MTAPPPEAASIFGQQLPLAVKYAEWLAGAGVERGLLGPREPDRLWDRHLLNCAVITELIPASASVLDVGSGAGLPGIVLAIRRPDLRITLVEPLQRRVDFLDECIAALALDNVSVLRSRAENVRVRADVVTSRAVAELGKLLQWCWPLVAPGGELVAMKGERAPDELATNRPELARRQLSGEVKLCGVGVLSEPTRVVVIRAAE